MPAHRAWTSAVALLGLSGSIYVAAAPQTLPPRALAPTLYRPASGGKTVDGAGFLRRWLVLEPIAATGGLTDSAVRRAVSSAYVPDQLTTVPRDGQTVTVHGVDLTWHAVDTTNYNVNLFHFARALNKPTSNVLFWAVTVVNVPQELEGVRLAIGSNAASVWWVDGEEVIGIYNDRQAVIDDGVSNRLTLVPGPHVIRGAIINGGGATDFCARFLDASDQPIRSISVKLPAEGR
jgi:hypothetical protein